MIALDLFWILIIGVALSSFLFGHCARAIIEYFKDIYADKKAWKRQRIVDDVIRELEVRHMVKKQSGSDERIF
jgi:hypothetical protein